MASWTVLAACRGMDPEIFHPLRGAKAIMAEAKAICSACPVQAECLVDNLGEQQGVWGGLSQMERRFARKWLVGGRPGRHIRVVFHGTHGMYRKGCRCYACREANARTQAQYKAVS